MPGKRQHYVPRFVLRRFAIDPTDKKSLVWRLDKPRGAPRKVNPANEVVISHYYRMVLDDGEVIDEADRVLTRIEDMAAGVIRRMSNPEYVVSGNDVYPLMLFIASLKSRTPLAREGLAEGDARAAELEFQVLLSDRARYQRIVGASAGQSEEEVEAGRLRLLEDLQSGRLVMQSPPGRDVALMFVGLEEVTETLFASLDITCMRIPADSKRAFVVSDNPVSHYDPTPTTPESGISFMSSPNSVTWLPLDPKFGLLLGQQDPQSWRSMQPDGRAVDELNLQTYAWALDAIYGPSQDAVTRVRRFAKDNRTLLHELRYRPPRVWVTTGSGEAGVHEFTSRHKGQTVKRKLYVDKSAAG